MWHRALFIEWCYTQMKQCYWLSTLMGLIVLRIQFAFLLINNLFNGNTASKYICCVNSMPVQWAQLPRSSRTGTSRLNTVRSYNNEFQMQCNDLVTLFGDKYWTTLKSDRIHSAKASIFQYPNKCTGSMFVTHNLVFIYSTYLEIHTHT